MSGRPRTTSFAEGNKPPANPPLGGMKISSKYHNLSRLSPVVSLSFSRQSHGSRRGLCSFDRVAFTFVPILTHAPTEHSSSAIDRNRGERTATAPLTAGSVRFSNPPSSALATPLLFFFRDNCARVYSALDTKGARKCKVRDSELVRLI